MIKINKKSDSIVIVIHEIYGINQHIKSYCELLSEQNFDVLCPNLLDKINPYDYSQEETASKVTHCLCVVRDDEYSPFKVLTPCGVCQERLRFWGTDVKVGVTTLDNSLKFVTLDNLQPYHWTNAYPVESLEHYSKD